MKEYALIISNFHIVWLEFITAGRRGEGGFDFELGRGVWCEVPNPGSKEFILLFEAKIEAGELQF